MDMHAVRELDMLYCLTAIDDGVTNPPVVRDLGGVFQKLDMCSGLDVQKVADVVQRTAQRLGHPMDLPVTHDVCIAYYNSLVEWINSYEARLADPQSNCIPQYTVVGLDMPHCLWINLDRAPDRCANMQMLLKGTTHTRISAVDAQEEEWMDLSQIYGLDRALKATPAERCCTMSHIRAFEAIQRLGLEVALVLEDDVTFKFIPPNFSFEKTIRALPSDWDVLHISARSNPPSKLLNIPYQFCEWRPKLCYSTAAFLINGKHIDRILAQVKEALRSGSEARADWVIYGNCRTYVLCRPIIDEDPFHFASAIHSENEEYHRRMHVALSELYCNEVRQELNLPLLPLTYAKGFKSSDLNDGTKLANSPMPQKPKALDDFRAERLEAKLRAKQLAAAAADIAAEAAALTPDQGDGSEGDAVAEAPQAAGGGARLEKSAAADGSVSVVDADLATALPGEKFPGDGADLPRRTAREASDAGTEQEIGDMTTHVVVDADGTMTVSSTRRGSGAGPVPDAPALKVESETPRTSQAG